MIWLAVGTTLLGCSTRDADAVPTAADREGLVAALALAETDPVAAMARCRDLGDAARADCVVAAAEGDAAAALEQGWCDVPARSEDREECRFVLAERLDRLDLCVRAGRFADDCRVHLWRNRVPRYMPPDQPLPDLVPKVRRELLEQGFDPDDEALWVASFAHYHEQSPDLGRSRCRAIEHSRLARLCWDVAREPFEERIGSAWTSGAVSCDAAALPPELAGMDPELRALFDQEWGARCAGKPPPAEG